MSGKFMNVRRIVMPIISMIILTSQLMGCSVVASADMIDMIDSGQEISIEVASPSYDTSIKGTQAQSLDWIQLDQLKTYTGFRQDFDKAFNINTITESGMDGKSGCLYVEAVTEERNGNATLMDALRNKIFVNNYWNKNEVKDAIAKAADKAYTDVAGNQTYQISGAINAYWNLIPNATNPEAFNPTASMSREMFYSMFYRAITPVQQALEDNSFDTAVGGKTNFTVYASKIDEFGFLSVTNKSLDSSSYKGSISRVESVYMLVNKLFPTELSKVTGKEKAFSDTKNAGDLALKAGFKDKKSDGTIAGKDRWQSYVLAYSLQHPDDGLQEDLYKAMVVAKDKGIISEDESRWDEAISNSEAIQMVVNAGLALNNSAGYGTQSEYGKINPDKFVVLTADGKTIQGTEAETEVNPAKVLSSGITLKEAKVKIDSIISGIEALGDTVDNNMDYINKQCESLGTTYTEINRLPATATQTQSQPAPVVKPVEKPVQQAPVQQQKPVQQAPVQQQKPVQQAPVQQAPVQDYSDADDLSQYRHDITSTDIDVESSLNAQKVN